MIIVCVSKQDHLKIIGLRKDFEKTEYFPKYIFEYRCSSWPYFAS